MVGTQQLTDRVILELADRRIAIDLGQAQDISIPVQFQGESFRAFGADPATSSPYRVGSFQMSVDKGAGCNCHLFSFSAHLHGTHTECVGHISTQEYILQDLVNPRPFTLALVISLDPKPGNQCSESYQPAIQDEDLVLTQESLQDVLQALGSPKDFDALIVRTLPNDPKKKTRDYSSVPPPYFSNEAMSYIKQLGVRHLLVDTPSVDRLKDDGLLSNHHLFWCVEHGSNDVPIPSDKSITEFVFVPSEWQDGLCLLSLNISNIRSDAAPSRPTLYRMEET